MGTRRHTHAPKITLITSSIAVTRAKRVSFSRLRTLLETKVNLKIICLCVPAVTPAYSPPDHSEITNDDANRKLRPQPWARQT